MSTPPDFNASQFDCPHCGALAQQNWERYVNGGAHSELVIHAAKCYACNKRSVWLTHRIFGVDHDRMVHPVGERGPAAPVDLPDAVSAIYEEAREVFPVSPRSASALLRLTLEGVLRSRYGKGLKLDEMIGKAKADGLSDTIIKAMDIVRVNGNESVHELHLDDDGNTAASLFTLLHLIVQRLITEPREVAELHDRLSPGQKAHIERRDGSSVS